jgi:hypothetical protein
MVSQEVLFTSRRLLVVPSESQSLNVTNGWFPLAAGIQSGRNITAIVSDNAHQPKSASPTAFPFSISSFHRVPNPSSLST